MDFVKEVLFCFTSNSEVSGYDYDIEAVFANPKNCTGFSFIVNGVYTLEDGKISTRRRKPYKREIDAISRVIESKSRELMKELREEFAKLNVGGA